MPDVSFVNLFGVVVLSAAIPFALGLAPRLRIPAVVIEIIAGILVGPAGLRLVERDTVVDVVAILGLAFLLFLGGLEIDVDRFRGPLLRRALGGFGLSIVLGLVVGGGLAAGGLVADPLLVAVILLATSLGVVVPVLKDGGVAGSAFGQAVIVCCTVADFGAIVLLSVFFTGGSGSAASQVLLLAGFVVFAIALGRAVTRAEGVARFGGVLAALQDTTAQIRIRVAVVLLVGLAATAQLVGLEVILGAFLAGAIVAAVDRDERGTHPLFRVKLEAIGFGFFIPVFFVASGMSIDVRTLLASPSGIVLVPLFLAGLAVVRGLPAVLLLRVVGRRRTIAAGLLQATSLPFIVAATQIGTNLGLLRPATAAALVAAGLVSVLAFPFAAVALLRRGEPTVNADPAVPGDPNRSPASAGERTFVEAM